MTQFMASHKITFPFVYVLFSPLVSSLDLFYLIVPQFSSFLLCLLHQTPDLSHGQSCGPQASGGGGAGSPPSTLRAPGPCRPQQAAHSCAK